MEVYRTGDIASQFVNVFVYGLAGAGKTPLAATIRDCLVITSEPGLLSLKSANMPYVLGRTHAEAMDVLKWAKGSNEARKFSTLFYDSISATSENIYLAAHRANKGDNRKISPETTMKTNEIIYEFLSIQNRNVIMTSKAVEIADQITGAKKAEPFAAVPKLGPSIPYHFDAVLFLSRHRKETTGEEFGALRCRENDYCLARNRTNALELWEPADLTLIVNKLTGKRV